MLQKNGGIRLVVAANNIIQFVLKNVSILAFGVMAVTILIGIFMRFILQVPNVYGEEISRYSMVVGVFFAVGLAVRHNAHMKIDILNTKLPKIPSRIIEFIARVVELYAYILFSMLCMRFVIHAMTYTQFSPSIKMPMWLIYMVLFVGFVFSGLESLLMLWNDFISKSKPLSCKDKDLLQKV